MANPEHVAILKRGVDVWNEWRKENPNIQPDISLVNLREIFLQDKDVPGDYIIGFELSGINLSNTNLSGTSLDRCTLNDANLSRTKLNGASLNRNLFIGADMSRAELYETSLRQSILIKASLTEADINATNFHEAVFDNTDLSHAKLGWSIFTGVDLQLAKGLDTITHRGPYSIGIDTIIKSRGHIPEVFLRNAGVPSSIIEQIPALIGSLSPIAYFSCFISHSSKDKEFADRLYADLLAKGVRCWFAPHDLRTGQRIRYGIDEAIRQYDKLILILSNDSIASTWVEFEVETALDKEKNGSEVLFPIRLDSTVLDSSIPWARYLKQTRHICDFTYWKNHEDYQKAFSRLLRDLKAGA